MTRIGFLGAFSIDNAGDAIVGLAGRQALRELLPDAEQITYAPRLPQAFWAHRTDREHGIDGEIVPVPASTDMAWAAGLDALVIGGGGIIQLDPAFRPFLLGDPDRWDGRPAAWNGVCSQNEPWYLAEGAGYRAVATCCEKLRYVSVRNRTTLAFVRHCGFRGEVHVVPDPALRLTVPPEVDATVDQILADSGVDRSRPLIGITLGNSLENPRAAEFYRDLFRVLAARVREGDQVALFAWSYMRGDERIRDLAARYLPGALVLRRRLGPLELWRLVGKTSFFVATRYHAMLAALAQDVPFVVVDEYLSNLVASSKTRELVADLGLEPNYLCPFLEPNPAWKLQGLIAARERLTVAARLTGVRARLGEHYAKMVAALGLR